MDIVAVCEQCGRGFVSLPRANMRDPFHPAEIAHQIFQAYLTFAVFDVARRAHLGLTPEQNTSQLGELFDGCAHRKLVALESLSSHLEGSS